MQQKWIKRWYKEALNKASYSQDVNTKVGSIIISEDDNVEVSSGWNCLPRKMRHTEERNSRPLKYLLTSHSEISAITNAARMGRSTKDKSLVVTMFPCSLCAAAIINAGITKVYSPKPDFNHVQYGESFKLSLEMFSECRVSVEYIQEEKE